MCAGDVELNFVTEMKNWVRASAGKFRKLWRGEARLQIVYFYFNFM